MADSERHLWPVNDSELPPLGHRSESFSAAGGARHGASAAFGAARTRCYEAAAAVAQYVRDTESDTEGRGPATGPREGTRSMAGS